MTLNNRAVLKSLQFTAENSCFLKFGHSVRNRWKRIILKGRGTHRKHRAGWRVALKRRTIEKMPIPKIVSCNIRSLLGKIDELQSLASDNEFKNVGAFLIQESWLTSEIDDMVVSLDGFDLWRSDRPVRHRNRGGGVVTYIRRSWSKSSHISYEFNSKHINALIVKCKPPYLSFYRCIFLVNIYIAPDTPSHEFDSFSDSLSCNLLNLLDNSLCIVAGDFNNFNTFFLSSLGLNKLVTFSTGLNAQLAGIFVNCEKICSYQLI